MIPPPPEKILRSFGWLSRQPVDFQNALLRRGRVRKFEYGDYMIQPDDPPGGIFAICDGAVGVYLTDIRSELVLAEILRKGVWFGERPLMDGKSRVRTFRAMEPTVVWFVELAHLNEIRGGNHDFARMLGTISLEAQDLAAQVIQDLLIPETERRIAAILLRVSGANDDPSEPAACISQGELAEMASLSRNSVGRALKRFESAGWIALSYRTIRLLEPEKLRQFLRKAASPVRQADDKPG